MRPSHRNALDRTLVVVCRCLGAAAVLVCLAALTPLPNYLVRSLQAEARLGPADAIVVLGSGIEPDGALSPGSLYRDSTRRRARSRCRGRRSRRPGRAGPLLAVTALGSWGAA